MPRQVEKVSQVKPAGALKGGQPFVFEFVSFYCWNGAEATKLTWCWLRARVVGVAKGGTRSTKLFSDGV